MAYVIAHGDLDGLAAAAVIVAALRRSRGVEAKLIIEQPYSLQRALLRATAAGARLVMVVDLGIDAGSWATIRGALTGLLSSGCRVVWVDHHLSTARYALELVELGASLLFATGGSVSTVAREVFAPLTDDPQFFTKLAVVGEVADGVASVAGELEYVAERLAAAVSAPSSREEFKLRLVSVWVNERRLVSDDVALRAEEFERVLAEKVSLSKQRVAFESEGGVVVDARGVKLEGVAGHVASRIAQERGKVTIVLFSPSERETVATCRVPPGVDFNAVEELVPLAEELGGAGGGLRGAASIRVPASAGDELLKRLRERLR